MALTKQSAFRKDKTNAFASTMEHRHFATVAAIIAELGGKERRAMANLFADRLRNTNPRFDRQRFLAACGVAD